MWWFSLLLITFLTWKSVLSKTHIATPVLFWLKLVWHIFLHPFIFNLYVSLYLKYVSCRQHIVWLHFWSILQSLSINWYIQTIEIQSDYWWINIYRIHSVFYLLPLLFVSVFVTLSFSAICCFNKTFYIIPFSFLS